MNVHMAVDSGSGCCHSLRGVGYPVDMTTVFVRNALLVVLLAAVRLLLRYIVPSFRQLSCGDATALKMPKEKKSEDAKVNANAEFVIGTNPDGEIR